jgi:hypothetical protein
MTKRHARYGRWGPSLALMAGLWLVACTGTPTVAPTSAPNTVGLEGGYPAPTVAVDVAPSGYPAQTSVPPTPLGAVPFVITRPLIEGMTAVTGTGRAGVPLLLQDVSFMGAPIAETTVDSEGQFSFNLAAPLERNHRVGITIGDLSGTNWNIEELLSPAYWGPGAQQLPQVTFYWDTELVGEP